MQSEKQGVPALTRIVADAVQKVVPSSPPLHNNLRLRKLKKRVPRTASPINACVALSFLRSKLWVCIRALCMQGIAFSAVDTGGKRRAFRDAHISLKILGPSGNIIERNIVACSSITAQWLTASTASMMGNMKMTLCLQLRSI